MVLFAHHASIEIKSDIHSCIYKIHANSLSFIKFRYKSPVPYAKPDLNSVSLLVKLQRIFRAKFLLLYFGR